MTLTLFFLMGLYSLSGPAYESIFDFKFNPDFIHDTARLMSITLTLYIVGTEHFFYI